MSQLRVTAFTGSFLLVSFCNLLWRHCVEYYNGFSGEFQKRQSSDGSPEEKYHCISAPVLSWHLSNEKKKWKKMGLMSQRYYETHQADPP